MHAVAMASGADAPLPFVIAGMLKSEPLMLPGRHVMNGGLALGNVGALGYFMYGSEYLSGLSMLGTTTALSSVMGVTLTMAIGGKTLLVLYQTQYKYELKIIGPINIHCCLIGPITTLY